MASIRRRKGTNKFVVDYFDQQGGRRLKTFDTKREAKDWLVTACAEVRAGTHTPDRKSITVLEAAQRWLERCTRRIGLDGVDKLEFTTVMLYRTQVNLDIAKSSLAPVRLSRLTMPMVEAFKDELRDKRVPPVAARAVLASLKAAISEAQRKGLVAQNVATGVKYAKRTRRLIVEGEDFPSKSELQAILAHAGEHHPLFVTAAFTGLRASELRGLRWGDIGFDEKFLRVRRRADKRRQVGDPKSEAGKRTIPLIDMVVNALRRHRVASRWSGEDDYVFANGLGRIAHYRIMLARFAAVQIAASIDPARYGLHALRHFYASWLIGLRHYSPKEIQTMLGHATLAMTFDTYGHLLKKSETEEQQDRAKLEAASREFRVITAGGSK